MANATRRAVFRAAGALPAMFAVPALARATPPAPVDPWPEFIRGLAWMHPDGRQAALNAQAAGMKVDECFNILLKAPHAQPGLLPCVMFKTATGYRSFRPCGEIV